MGWQVASQPPGGHPNGLGGTVTAATGGGKGLWWWQQRRADRGAPQASGPPPSRGRRGRPGRSRRLRARTALPPCRPVLAGCRQAGAARNAGPLLQAPPRVRRRPVRGRRRSLRTGRRRPEGCDRAARPAPRRPGPRRQAPDTDHRPGRWGARHAACRFPGDASAAPAQRALWGWPVWPSAAKGSARPRIGRPRRSGGRKATPRHPGPLARAGLIPTAPEKGRKPRIRRIMGDG